MSEHCNCGHEHHHEHLEDMYQQALNLYNFDIKDEEVKEAVQKIIAEKVPENNTPEVIHVWLYRADNADNTGF